MNSQLILSIIGAAVGVILGIVVFGNVAGVIDCPGSIGTTNTLGVVLTFENYNKYQTITDPIDPADYNNRQKNNAKSGKLNPIPINSFTDEFSDRIMARQGITTDYVMNDIHYNPGKEECQKSIVNAWTVLGILPLSLFFLVFVILGMFRND